MYAEPNRSRASGDPGRVSQRFLFIRWGTKAIRQEVVSSNPHTRIVYTDYIKLTGKKQSEF